MTKKYNFNDRRVMEKDEAFNDNFKGPEPDEKKMNIKCPYCQTDMYIHDHQAMSNRTVMACNGLGCINNPNDEDGKRIRERKFNDQIDIDTINYRLNDTRMYLPIGSKTIGPVCQPRRFDDLEFHVKQF